MDEEENDTDPPLVLDLENEGPSLIDQPLATGQKVIAAFARTAPLGPGVYRMMNAAHEVLYVGKARSIRKRVMSYVREQGHTLRISRMIAQTASMECISTTTETEALLLEANLIKQLKPRFNVLLRDDKSFPYIVLRHEHGAVQLMRHRGSRHIKGDYFGPFASGHAVTRTLNALQRAFLLRSCADAVYDSRTRPCLLHQIRRCSAPCTQEISQYEYDQLVCGARAFLSGKSSVVRQEMVQEMKQAAERQDYETAAAVRDRLAALSAIQSGQGVNPHTFEEADVFALHQQAGAHCIEVFFFRTGQNWGNRAYFPRADRTIATDQIMGSFIAQFYNSRPCPRLLLLSHTPEDQELLAEALSARNGSRVDIAVPRRGEKYDILQQALRNARQALERKLAEAATQQQLLSAVATTFGLSEPPRRIEIYDNSHISGTHAVGVMVVAGPEGFEKNQYRKFNIKSADLTPGDDFAMMREVLERRFSRLLKEEAEGMVQRPDLLLIDGGAGQLSAVMDTLAELGVHGLPVIGIAKGVDRDAGRERFFRAGHRDMMLSERDPVLFFVQRLRDEAHRFAIGTHRATRSKALSHNRLDDIAGIGPTRRRALMHHFGTVKAVAQASVEDLMKVDGVSEQMARAIHGYFHEEG